ncbi:MAG TPA: DUF2059 domain-containing protein [Candidatus Acidoferrum sp.]|jgi:hypothetical protein|nr:DUF2059 domain-containing protein [Candidatus Acidoferrum sp.]
MKAVLALLIIYVGTFFLVIQGASQNAVQAAHNAASAPGSETTPQKDSLDPAKAADIRSLIELLGVRDALPESAAKSTAQYREALLSSVPDNERGQAFVNAFLDAYQKRLNPDDITNELVAVYDKHFTEDEIKGLLQFYGSPLGQKYAEETPKVSAEVNVAGRAVSLRVARDVIQELRKQYPGVGAQARLQKPHPGQQAPAKQQAQTEAQQGPTQP